ncbi:GatB/YqeY domain-containing protein [Pseudogemmatithrix spongiicola]|uniref:GatB/YqeY domain-containing protein n=1 Tax=Pseudogemmatithrix spongiicola TaxID=3062599 RepID=A0AA49JUT9_9BACT|nr:GatB/YqeY domain-containing protein [Gemmatimonadaceae bacterium 'strain 138']WKW15334.1 GatB/YqeY domain-containing protein [Gemmatimonadaceae bacterium 'strain 318']
MSALAARLQGELNVARKAQDKERVLLLGTVLADIRNHEIAIKRLPTDDDVVEVIRKAIKRRRESVEMFEKGGRAEQAATERREAEALEAYLPAAPTDDEVRAAVRAAIVGGAKQMGAVMGKVMPAFKGRLDGNVLNRIVREELGTSP